MANPKPTILKISAKCSDLCSAVLIRNGKMLAESDGYVPSLMPNGGGDYVDIDIDIATGQILNWKVPTEAQIKAFIAGRDEDDDEEDEEEDKFSVAAFDQENGISLIGLGLIDIWLCSTCQKAETRKPASETKHGECDCCETVTNLLLYRVIA